MANKLTSNPIIIDTANNTSRIDRKIFVTGIQVVASNDTWVAILKSSRPPVVDDGGDINFHAISNITNDRSQFYPINSYLDGLYASTLTDITRLLIYTK